MEDILDGLEEISTKEKPIKTPEVVQESILGRIDYDNLKKVIKTTSLFAVKNVGKKDLITDWDLNLMPEDLKPEFDKYLTERYNVYQVKETNLDFRIVAIFREGRTINFLHQFMTEKKVPNLETVQEGKETFIKSQFALPVGATAVVTQEQYESLKRFEKRRAKTESGDSDWFGFLAFKELKEQDLKKLSHSFVSVKDIKNNEFEVAEQKFDKHRSSATMEYSDEIEL